MSAGEVQEKLNAFYRQALHELKEAGGFTEAQQAKLSSPFLLNISDEYFKAPVRILFVGQETAGWVGKLGSTLQKEEPLIPLLENYARLMRMPRWRSAFLKKYRLVEQKLGGGIRGSIVWSNLQRMDVDRGAGRSRNSRKYSDHLDAFSDKLFRYEVELLQPDVIIFACGPNYDHLIKRYFPEYKTDVVIEPRALWRFNIGRIRCYRTWHPRTIRPKGATKIKWYFQEIIADVRENFSGAYA
ncbi:hypothetical protein [Caldimonas tepidiphila]|uniref:hypothetical protein n=1 Tax=Caldimonas tepidiphila TaxID=2315841 RepID=UPI000E5B0223|nr:hypothetical protein [Caldimonas tepidiphila]